MDISTKQRTEGERFERWWATQDWDGAYTDVAWEAWWEAVRDSTDEEIIEVLAPASTRERDELRADVERWKRIAGTSNSERAANAEAEVERLNESVIAHNQQLRQQVERAVSAEDENERLRAQLKAEHETAIAAIAGSEKEIERLRAALEAHHSLSFPNSDPDYTCRECGFDGTDVPPLRPTSAGGRWADLQSETEAADGDQVV